MDGDAPPPIFVPSYHRPDNCKTVHYLRKLGYDMSLVHVVIDDAAGDEAEYRAMCAAAGATLHVVGYEDAVRRFDFVHRKNPARRAAGMFRNRFFPIADELGIDFFVVVDDDTNAYHLKYPQTRQRKATLEQFSWWLCEVRAFMRRHRIGAFGLSQSGDNLIGCHPEYWFLHKVMNTTFYDARLVRAPERGVQDDDTSAFVGYHNAGLFTGSLGYGLMLYQTPSATAKGGLTDVYRESKLMNKSLVCPIQFPSAIHADKQPLNGGRIHHKIAYRYLAPRVLKCPGAAGNVAWDTFPEDVPFTNEPKREGYSLP